LQAKACCVVAPTKDSLIVVPQGNFNATTPKITVRLNQKIKEGKAASVVSLGSAKTVDLSNSAIYDLLLGQL
jgi:hypothetical protein